MTQLTQQNLLNTRAHFGHLSSKWHPNFAPFIFMKRKGVHIIDLKQTQQCLVKAAEAMKALIQTGKKILFVSTKKQGKEFVEQAAKKLEQPYVTRRWLGGTLTNFSTMRRLFKDLASIDQIMQEPTYLHLTKREQLMMVRKKKKLEELLQGISTINRLPSAIFVVDIKKEEIAIKEANKLGIPIFAIVDTNTNPLLVDYPIPANDDASACIELILNYLEHVLKVGLESWKQAKGALATTHKKVGFKAPIHPGKKASIEKISQTPATQQANNTSKATPATAQKNSIEKETTPEITKKTVAQKTTPEPATS